MRVQRWAASMVAVTVAAVAAAVVLDPGAKEPGAALTTLLLVGASMHVAATGWYVSIPHVRAMATTQTGRFVAAPLALLVASAVVAGATSERAFEWTLLGFFSWQLFHFQRQNLGLVALAAAGTGGRLTPADRRLLDVCAFAGIGVLLSRPEIMQLSIDTHLGALFPLALLAWIAALIAGADALRRDHSAAAQRALFVMALLYVAPLFVFRTPFAAIGGLTIAHGLQYLVLTGLVAGARTEGVSRAAAPLLLFNVAVLGGLALRALSHLHSSGTLGRAMFGLYVGAVMAHFVVDAGIWRLRDELPRRLVDEYLPYLSRHHSLQPGPPS